ncbi:NAD-dependent epimerase/dehydratase family protein [Parasphingorhabdus pacifica]
MAVTGANGNIGRILVGELTDTGHQVRAIDRTAPAPQPGIEPRRADACDFHQLHDALHGADAIIHLAGIPNPLHEPDHTVHNTNVTASYNMLAAAVRSHINTVCLASSINAIGGAFSHRARYDYFPVDEQHPTYNEDPYGLSKWISEQQADSFARAHPDMTITSLRLHGATPDRTNAAAQAPDMDQALLVNHLWGYVRNDAATRALRLALERSGGGHEVVNLVAPDTVVEIDSAELARRHWPDVPVRRPFHENSGFYDCDKARRLLGWTHSVH